MAWSPFSRGKRRGPWLPAVRDDRSLSAEQEQLLDHDDLAELLAATNAKRAARGKAHLSAGDVELRVFFEEQQMRRSGPEL